MALGTNIKKGNQVALANKLLALLGHRKQAGAKPNHVKPRIYFKAGVPASNTAADDPGAAGVIVIDTTNSHAYVCSAYTNSGSFTMTQMA